MKKYRSFFICALISIALIITVNSSPFQCPLTTDQVNTQVLNQHPIPCLQKALLNGWNHVIDHLVKQRQAQHKQQFIFLLQQQLKRLQILQQDIVLGTSQTEPILKWGQNRTHVFITFKLSHRWDSPPCLYTQGQQSRLETDAFFYNNLCVVSHQKVNFKVNLNLYKSVMLSMKDAEKREEKKNNQKGKGQEVSQKSSSQYAQSQQSEQLNNLHANYSQYQFDVKKDGVGQYSTILLKKLPEIWIYLTSEQKNYPTWHQIGQRFPQEFREYEKSLNTHRFVQRQRQASEASSRPATTTTSNTSSSYQGRLEVVVLLMALMWCVCFY